MRVGWGANWGGKALDQCLAVMRESVVRLQGREKVPCLPEAPAPPWGPWSIVTPPLPQSLHLRGVRREPWVVPAVARSRGLSLCASSSPLGPRPGPQWGPGAFS